MRGIFASAAVAGLASLLILPSVNAAPKLPAGCRPAPVVEGREITGEAADRLRLSSTTERLPRAGEYRLRDGRVLLQSSASDAGTVFSAADFARRESLVTDALHFRRVAAGEGFHPLRGLIDDGDRFAAQADTLIADLGRRLVREGLSDGDAGVDALAARWRESRCRPDPALFRELTAWAGRATLARFSVDPYVPKKAAWTTGTGPSDRRDPFDLVEPLVEGTWKSLPRVIAPWEIAMRLLDDDGTSIARLVDDTVAAAPFIPVAVEATTPPTKVEIRSSAASTGIPAEKP